MANIMTNKETLLDYQVVIDEVLLTVDRLKEEIVRKDEEIERLNALVPNKPVMHIILL